MKDCVLILENIRSVENTGSIFRTAEALGVREIVLVGTTPAPIDRFGRKRKDFIKISLGAEDMISWRHEENLDFIKKLLENGYEIISLEQGPHSKDLKNFDCPKKFALVVGNEVTGVSEEALDLSKHIVEIPMKGKKESLNASVATGVALYMLL